MVDVQTVVDSYFAFWNEPDPARRTELAAEVFASEARYVGPLFAGEGLAGIEALASQLREHLGDQQFMRSSGIESHHDVVRYRWEISPAAGDPPFAAGVDVGTLDADGRLSSVAVFLDLVPPELREHLATTER